MNLLFFILKVYSSSQKYICLSVIVPFDSQILLNPDFFMPSFFYLLYVALNQTILKFTSLKNDQFITSHGLVRAWLDDSSGLC